MNKVEIIEWEKCILKGGASVIVSVEVENGINEPDTYFIKVDGSEWIRTSHEDVAFVVFAMMVFNLPEHADVTEMNFLKEMNYE